MASITFRKSTKYGTEPYVVLTVSQGSQDTTNNRTYVSWSLVLYRPSNVSSSGSKSYSVVINGTTVVSSTYSIGGSGTKTINSGGLYVPHNSDGTKTLSFSGSVQFGITWSGTSIGTITNSGSMTLTPINIDKKMSTLIVSSNTLYLDGNSSITAYSIPNSTGVTDTAVLKFGSNTKTLTLGTPFKIPLSWITAIPSTSASADATITLTTKSGSTTVGTVSNIVDFIMPETLGKPSKPMASIKSKSLLQTDIALVRPSTYKYGATFANWEVSCNTGEVEITDDNVATFTREADDNVTTVVYARAIDSRGFASETIPVYCYIRKKGFCIYDSENDGWKRATPYIFDGYKYKRINGSVYFDDTWKKPQGVVEGLPELEGASYLTDESGNILTDENGNYLIIETSGSSN